MRFMPWEAVADRARASCTRLARTPGRSRPQLGPLYRPVVPQRAMPPGRVTPMQRDPTMNVWLIYQGAIAEKGTHLCAVIDSADG